MPAVSYKPHYTIEDYFLWEGDWELWNGIPVSMAPSPDFFHQTVSGNLHWQFKNLLKSEGCTSDCRAIYEIDWHVDASTVVRPDIMVVCEKPSGRWIEKRPELAVEILSPSTRQKDLTAKRDLYAANGVPFYLIVDPEGRSALLLSLDGKGTYRELPPETPFELHPGCVMRLEIPALFA